MKLYKVVALFLILSSLCTQVCATNVPIDTFKGLQRTPKADRIEDGAHDIFQNVFVNYGNIQVVKGRNRLNTTAHSDITVNGLWYYESQDSSIKKIIVAESTNLVSYAIDGTSRTVLASGLVNEKWDAVQIGDTEYLTSSTNGLYKWTGTGSATLVGTAPAASSIAFSTSTTTGSLTAGIDALVAPKYSALSLGGTDSVRYPTGASSCTIGPVAVQIINDNSNYVNINCTSLNTSNWSTSCATSSIYQYKLTEYNSVFGLESEASSGSSVSLTGANQLNTTRTGTFGYYTGSTTCSSTANPQYTDSNVQIIASSKVTSTTATMLAAPSTPYNGYCIYRTVASGTEFFKVGCITTGFSTTYKDGKADVSLSTPLDTTIDTISPPSFRYIEEYKGVIFVAKGDTIKFNKIPVNTITDADTYWLNTDEFKVTGNITGLIKASDSLLIFTKNSIYQLTGFGADSFKLTPIISGVGAINDETIRLDTNGDVYFVSGTDGVYKLSIGQQLTDSLNGAISNTSKNARIIKLSSPNLDTVFRGEDSLIPLSSSDLTTSHAYYDTDNNLYHIYIKDFDLLFNVLNSTWSYIPATQALASVWRKSSNSSGVGVLLDNAGFFFNNWTGYANGITSGTVTGTTTSSTSTTLTCSTCSFNTTGDGLKGLWIYLDNVNGEYRQIASNTSTTITVSSAWSANPIITDKFYVAYIVSEWRTKQYSIAKIPQETSVTLFFLNHNKSDSVQELIATSFQEKSPLAITAFNEGSVLDLSQKFINILNTRMRSSWVQWGFKGFVYNTSNTVNPPIDIISYAVEAEAKDKVS